MPTMKQGMKMQDEIDRKASLLREALPFLIDHKRCTCRRCALIQRIEREVKRVTTT
jgi:hypothetical protein